MAPVGRQTGYQDPVELELERHVDLTDPLERTAIALHRLKFATPEDVAALFQRGHDELTATWLAIEPSDRRLYRLRADVIAAIHAGEDR